MTETRLAIAVEDEATPAVRDDTRGTALEDVAVAGNAAGRTLRVRPPVSPPLRRVSYAGAGTRVIDQPMRLPSFDATCPHVRDQIIPLNGCRFNVDHYLRVLRAKAELDVSVAMALTVRAD